MKLKGVIRVLTLKNSREQGISIISKVVALMLLVVLCLAVFTSYASSYSFLGYTNDTDTLLGKISDVTLKKYSNNFKEELEVVVGQNTSAIVTFKFHEIEFAISGVDIDSEAFQNLKYVYLVFTSFSEEFDLYWPKPVWEYPEGVTLVLCIEESAFENALNYAYSIYRNFSQALGLGELFLVSFTSIDGSYAFMFNKFLNSSVSIQYAQQLLVPVLPEDGLANLINLNLIAESLFYGFSIGFVKEDGKLVGNVFVSWLNPFAIFWEDNEFILSVNHVVNHASSIVPSGFSTSSTVKIRFPYVVNATEFFVEPIGGYYFGRSYVFDLLSLGSAPDIGLKYNFDILPYDIPIVNAFVEVRHSRGKGMGDFFNWNGYGFHANITIYLENLGFSEAYNVTVMFPYSILEETFSEISFCDFNMSGGKLIAHKDILKRGEHGEFTFVAASPYKDKWYFKVKELREGAVIIYEDKVGRKYAVYANSFGFDIPIIFGGVKFEFKLHPTIKISVSSPQVFLNETPTIKININRFGFPISNAKISLYSGWVNPVTLDLRTEKLIVTKMLGSESYIEIPLKKMRKVGYQVVYAVLTYELDQVVYEIYSNVVPLVIFPEKVEAKYPYPLPVLNISKSLKGELKVGEQVWVSITVGNVGDENTTITLYEVVPDAFKVIKVELSKGEVLEQLEIEIGDKYYRVIVVGGINLGIEEAFQLRILVKVVHASVIEVPPTTSIATTNYEDFEAASPSASEIIPTNTITTYSETYSVIVNLVKFLTYNTTTLLYLIGVDTILLLFVIIKLRKQRKEILIPTSL